jgi:mRNA interferase HigB
MRITQASRLSEFAARHADTPPSLNAWANTVERAAWHSLMDVRKTYSHADAARVASGKVVTIFNIKGNHYRLITAIDYRLQVVNILRLLTHAEYDKAQRKKSL